MSVTELTVLVEPVTAVDGWRVRFRPGGPAGHIVVRLPFGITVYLDRADPGITLEIASATGDPAGLALLRTMFGPASAALVEAGRAGEAVRQPDSGELARSLQALIWAVGTASQRPAVAIIDQAALASRLASDYQASGQPELARLLERMATVCGVRGAGALRVLPSPSELGLDVEARRLLADAVATVRNLVGDEVGLGPAAGTEPGTADHDLAELVEDGHPFGLEPLEPAGTALSAALREKVRARPASDATLPSGAQRVDVGDWDLPVRVERLWLTGTAARGYRLEGTVTLLVLDDDETVREIESPAAPTANPAIWARALRRGDGMVLYVARCLISAGRLSATLHVSADFNPAEGFWIDLATDPTAPRPLLMERRADRARAEGARAAAAQRIAATAEQWMRVSVLWIGCARLWSVADDRDRATLASIHAARARLAAGRPDDFPSLARERAALDPRWLAPDLAQRARPDPFDTADLIKLARLGPYLTDWVAAELEKAIGIAVPLLNRRHLGFLLDLLPASAEPDSARLRRLRARARVALAYQASRRPETLPIASVLLAPAAADWPFLDEQGRERFAEANLALIEPVRSGGARTGRHDQADQSDQTDQAGPTDQTDQADE